MGAVFVVSRLLVLFLIDNHWHHHTTQWHHPTSSKITFLQRCPGRWRRSQPPSGCSRSRQPPPWWWWSLQCWWCRDQPDHVEQIFDRSLTTTITQLASEFANLEERNCNLLFLFAYVFVWLIKVVAIHLSWCSLFRREQQRCQTQRFLFFLLTL